MSDTGRISGRSGVKLAAGESLCVFRESRPLFPAKEVFFFPYFFFVVFLCAILVCDCKIGLGCESGFSESDRKKRIH